METNSTTTNNDGGGDGNDNGVVNWVALVVSLVALLGTVAQVLQQYISSATGYSNCDESVMGRWHTSKKRNFKMTELRFEVQFETPVIFVCPPTNTRGPIEEPGAYPTLLPTEEEVQRRLLQQSGVHTADNERASWVTLLSQLQFMEKESREWQQHNFNKGPPLRLPLVNFQGHTLAVAIQAKKRSWDTMPSSVKKPYATIAICHLLEIAAMMGIYWKEFDRSCHRYRAEGNGYILTGSNLAELGLIFTLQICGKNRFQDNRVIPVDEVKELCCGFISTLFQHNTNDRRRIESPNEDPKGLSFLQLGSMSDIAETMVLIECNTVTANYFRSDNTNHSHLFPVPFELIGMLGKTLHIRNSAFRMLPNPTPYHWDKKFINIRRLLFKYFQKITDRDVDIPQVPQIEKLAEDTDTLIHILRHNESSETTGYSMPVLDALHDVLDGCDEYLRQSGRDLVLMVIREHFQEVLNLINKKSGADGNGDGQSTDNANRYRAETFDDLITASPELRQEIFMDLYFIKVLSKVRERAVVAYGRSMTQDPGFLSVSSSEPIEEDESRGSVSALWCTLVLRMLCWLLLHDFDKKDVQIAKSELMGSRLTVYIA